MRKRYYLHGDHAERSAVYCARCDLFVSREHLDEAHDFEGNVDRYRRGFAFYGSGLKRYFRPAKAPNVFAELGIVAPTSSARSISQKTRFRIFKRDCYRCRICGADETDGVKLHLDHKVPVSRGGTSDEDNLWTLCAPCNQGKGAELL